MSDDIQALTAKLNETGSLSDAKALREAQAESRYSGLTGHLLETSDIMAEKSVTYAEALTIQQERAAHREQEYRDAIAEAESNVIQFRPRGK
jgi:hypothetical protein